MTHGAMSICVLPKIFWHGDKNFYEYFAKTHFSKVTSYRLVNPINASKDGIRLVSRSSRKKSQSEKKLWRIQVGAKSGWKVVGIGAG